MVGFYPEVADITTAHKGLLIALLTVFSARIILYASEYTPDDLSNMSKYGCDIALTQDPASHDELWFVHAWVRFTDKMEWIILEGVYPEKARSKALAGCDKWMEAIKMEIKKEQHGKGKS